MHVMTMGPRKLALLAAAGSLLLLLGALGFQYLGGLAPCALCIWQRWPHLMAVVLGAFSLRFRRSALYWLGAASALASAGVGLFHTGVEKAWWQGLSSCSGALELSGLSKEEALQAILSAPVARCDEVAWQLAGLSMASWNAILSLGLAILWALAARRAL